MASSVSTRCRTAALVVASASMAGVPRPSEFSVSSGSQTRRTLASATSQAARDRIIFLHQKLMWWHPMLQHHRVKCEETNHILMAVARKTPKMCDVEKDIDTVKLLRKSDILSATSPEALDFIAENACHRIWVKEGTVVIEEAQLHDLMVIVAYGKLTASGACVPATTLGPGQVFNETSAVARRLSHARLQVHSKTALILCLGKDDLSESLTTDEWERMAAVANTKDMENASHDFLFDVPLFKGASEEFLQAIAKKLKFVTFDKQSQIFTLGEADNKGMFYIKSGKLGIYDAEGQVATLGENTVVGETMLIGGRSATRNATVRVLEHVEAYQLGRQDFLKLSTEFPSEFNFLKKQSALRSQSLLSRKKTKTVGSSKSQKIESSLSRGRQTTQ